jgi:isopentenyl-diphosphate Delta-isomerase
MARPFLAPAMESADAVVEVIERVHREFRIAMFLLGCGRVNQLQGHEELILEDGQGDQP